MIIEAIVKAKAVFGLFAANTVMMRDDIYDQKKEEEVQHF